MPTKVGHCRPDEDIGESAGGLWRASGNHMKEADPNGRRTSDVERDADVESAMAL